MFTRFKNYLFASPTVSAVVLVALFLLIVAGIRACEEKLYERRAVKYHEQQQQLQQQQHVAEEKKEQHVETADEHAAEARRITDELDALKHDLRAAEARRQKAVLAEKPASTPLVITDGVATFNRICADYERITGDRCSVVRR